MRKFAFTHRTENNQTDGSKTETTLSSVDTRGSWPTQKVKTLNTLISGNDESPGQSSSKENGRGTVRKCGELEWVVSPAVLK